MTEKEILSAGLHELGLGGEEAIEKLLEFSVLLLEKNRVMNLTAVSSPREVVTRHFLDCAVLAPLLPAHAKVVDVGCGAGFPGVPLALLADAEVLLLDSLKKRILWLQEVCETLPIPNASAVHARAEEFGHREGFDVADLSIPLVRVGGQFLAMKADDCMEEVGEARAAIAQLGGEIEEVRAYTVPQSGLARRLVVVRKVSETPARFPRRFAKISAKPL